MPGCRHFFILKVMNIFIADDQNRVRFGLRVLLERQPEMRVAGEATDAQELLRWLPGSAAHLLLLEWELPGLSSLRLVEELRRRQPDLVIILLVSRPEEQRKAALAGADACVSKADSPERFLNVIDSLFQHR